MNAKLLDLHDTVRGLEDRFLARTWSRYPLTIERAEGCYLWDTNGRRYLDFLSGLGVNALGSSHPRLVRTIREQAGLCVHTSNLFQHRYQGELARRLVEWSGLSRVFFSNSGTEAIEAALKAARLYGNRQSPKRRKLVALANSFHGRSFACLSVTGQEAYRDPFEPLPGDVVFVEPNDVAALRAAVDESTVAVIAETVQGEGGIHPLTPEFVAAIREASRSVNALWIADETQCGLGRTGWRFAFQRFSPRILPDIIVTAKPLGGGLPLAATIFSEGAAVFEPGMHGTTFGGGPLACRVALEVLGLIDELLPAVRKRGATLLELLKDLQSRHAVVKDVRGVGLMAAIELAVPGKPIVEECLNRGLVIQCTHQNVLRFLPPYVVTPPEIDHALSILEQAMTFEL